MSKLSIDQNTIIQLLSDKKSDFVIPDYQRPYAWTREECAVLWDDIRSFAIPGDDSGDFDVENDEYFLGPIVTFRNEDGKLEVIDGQQRLTTFYLLLRALYRSFGSMKDDTSDKVRQKISGCIWKTDEFGGNPDFSRLKLDSQVATEDDWEEFKEIMRTGEAPKDGKSNYAENYRFFSEKIEEFIRSYPSYLQPLANRFLENCIVLPIEAQSQDTALMIFSTLNNRGMPLSDADIFKSQMYRHYRDQGRKDEFVESWKELEEGCNRVFDDVQNNPLDEIFTRYMYCLRAARGIKLSTTEGLRRFYEADHYEVLKRDSTMPDLLKLMCFWERVRSESDWFSDEVLRRLFVLDNAPNRMWTYILSVYFMKNSDSEGRLEDGPLVAFLDKIIAFIWTYAVTNPGVNALRTPIYAEMVNIMEGRPVEFADHRFEEALVRSQFRNFQFTNQRPITRSMLAWWVMRQPDQGRLSTETRFDIEHIYPSKRQEKDGTLEDPASLEMLGNKSLLEARINIAASDYRFADKRRYYQGNVGRRREPTAIAELLDLAERDDFTEQDIHDRDDRIIDGLMEYLRENGLLIE